VKLTNTQRYIMAGLLAGGHILKVSHATSSWSIRGSYKFVGPDGEVKCTVDERTFKKFLEEGILTGQGNKWVVTPAPAAPARGGEE